MRRNWKSSVVDHPTMLSFQRLVQMNATVFVSVSVSVSVAVAVNDHDHDHVDDNDDVPSRKTWSSTGGGALVQL